MIGQCYSKERFNVIILAAGAGNRMGESAAYIPKALTPLGNQRAIDHIIFRYRNVAEKFIIGVHTHADLLINYLKGRYPTLNIEFCVEQTLENNAKSVGLCLDHADSRFPTLVHFCDLLMLDNFELEGDQLFFVDSETKGNMGTFRHIWNGRELLNVGGTIDVRNTSALGLLGVFSFQNTPSLKSFIYSDWSSLYDFTENGVFPYYECEGMEVLRCGKVIEFGNKSDIEKARELWETI
jgi:hypothetical protein